MNPEEKEACRSVPEWLRSDDAADLHIVDKDLRLEVMYDPPTKISIFTTFLTHLVWT